MTAACNVSHTTQYDSSSIGTCKQSTALCRARCHTNCSTVLVYYTSCKTCHKSITACSSLAIQQAKRCISQPAAILAPFLCILRVVVLRCLREVCANGQLLVDLFVNYDCDLGSSNLFERLINGLVKMAQNPLAPGLDHTQIQQEQWLRQEALQCLSSAAEALLHWYRGHTGGQGSADDRYVRGFRPELSSVCHC